jgi:YD repeat-containing protein
VKWTKPIILLISIFAALLTTAQPTATGASPEESTATMPDREQGGLRGPVKSYTEESTYAGVTYPEGKTYEVHSEYTTGYDVDGHMVDTRSSGSDGSGWVTCYTYDGSGRLLKTTSGKEGEKAAETIFSYNDNGKLVKISRSDAPENPTVFHYDENGRKTKVQVFRAVDYRSGIFEASLSPFQIADNAPNLPGGGTATTIYDERDRATEVQVRGANGELVIRAVRIYDAQGHIVDEKRILENPETMFPAEALAKLLEQTGVSPDQLRQELRAQLTKLMGGQSGWDSVSYSYDTHGRVNHRRRRFFNKEIMDIETIYNQHGDVASEITRSEGVARETGANTPAPGMAPYSEVSYSYKYDDHGNWTEKVISYRSSPDGAFQSSTVIKRTLTYY